MTRKIKILTTDSGLGGLSVTAELVEKIKTGGQFEQAEIIFFNCLPSDKFGYAYLENNQARADLFDNALYAMREKFQPDVIIIACNTLSAVYEMSEFSKSPLLPVVGIIEDGAKEIANLLLAHPEMQMLMFATPATVSSNIHKKILTERGIDSKRLHYQSCLDLPKEIISGAESDKVKKMIENFMELAVAKTKGKTFAISLLCTHFAYSLPVFSEIANSFENFSADIINPNSTIVNSFLEKYESGKFIDNKTSIKCYTHTPISPEIVKEIFPLLEKISPDTAEAFLNIIDSPAMF